MSASTTTTKPKAKAPSKTPAKAKKARLTNAAKLATFIVKDFNGEAKFSDLAKHAGVKRALPTTTDSAYRHLQGIVTRDKGQLFERSAPGTVKVKVAK